jgi:HlyD family secretion protein
VAASRKSKRFWIWLSAVVLLVALLLAVGVTRLGRGAAIDPNRLARVTRGDVAR